MKNKAIIEIESCKECRHCEMSRVYTGDSFEFVQAATCKKAGKEIDGYVETFDDVPVPKWCPILKKPDSDK